MAVVPGCTFAYVWRVTLELVESVVSICLTHSVHTFQYNGAESQLKVLISGVGC